MDVFIQKLITVSPKKLMGKNCAEIYFAGTNLQVPFLNKDENVNMDSKYAMNLRDLKQEILGIKKNTKTIILKCGEPCLQRLALKSLCSFIKEQNMFVALETYGTKPKVLKNLLDENLIDIVILKLLFPIQEKWMSKINKGTLLTNSKEIIADIKKSIELIGKYNIKVHATTKIVPSFIYRTTDLEKIGGLIKNMNNLVWELIPFNSKEAPESFSKIKAPTEDFMEEIKHHLVHEFPMMNIR